MSCIAGYHKLYWLNQGDSGPTDSGDYLGVTGPEGINYIEELNHSEITGDALGPSSIIDGVYQGKNVTLEFALQSVGSFCCKSFLNPFTYRTSGSIETVTSGAGNFGIPGTLHSSYVGVLEAIPETGTPAASLNSSGGSCRRFYGLFIGPKRESLDVNQRIIPVRFRCFPWSDSADSLIKIYKWISAIGATLTTATMQN